MDNLGTLCHKCHDIAELELHGDEVPALPEAILPAILSIQSESVLTRHIDWRRIVYGGHSRQPGDRL